jgi:hypothetical protein
MRAENLVNVCIVSGVGGERRLGWKSLGFECSGCYRRERDPLNEINTHALRVHSPCSWSARWIDCLIALIPVCISVSAYADIFYYYVSPLGYVASLGWR